MCKVGTKIAPVIIGALGTINEELDQNLQLLSGHTSGTELQKITIINTANIVCEVLG
jgi:hypothetical protein